MGLEKEKKEEIQEKKTNEGGEEVSKEDIRKDVLAVMAEEREKTTATENLGSIRKQVDHLEGEIGEVKKVLCAPGGGPCFTTQEQLDAYLKATDEKIGKIGTLLTEVVEKVNAKPVKSELPAGVKVLEPMTEEKRKTMTDEQNRTRDDQVAINDRALNQTTNDGYRQMQEQDKDNIVNKADMRRRFLKTLTPEEIKEAMVIGCKDGKCKVIRGELENTEGYKIYKKDEGGRFQPIDQEEKKPLIF